MVRWLFVGPTLLAGIGQVTHQYAKLVNGDFVSFGDQIPNKDYDVGFGFVLPIIQHLTLVDQMLARCKKKMYMTICETETVHPLYQLLVERYGTLWTPSEFCLNVFKRQFPQGNWKLLRLYAPVPKQLPLIPNRPYTFYTIGNVLDQRKNIKMLLEAFIRMKKPEGRQVALLIKATCKEPFVVRIPGIEVINGLVSDEDLNKIHARSDCYVNCSHSEGVGMGAYEAALRNKPVILPEYGGLKEYVQTPFIIGCGLTPIGSDDFLFQKDMLWGKPKLEDLIRHMETCAEQNIQTWDHSYSHQLNLDTIHSLETCTVSL